MIEDDKVEYIKYYNNEKELEYWGISPVTNIAHKLLAPKKPRRNKKSPEYKEYEKQLNHFNQCTGKADPVKVKYITEHLIKLGYCNFETDGNLYHFSKYFDNSRDTTMITKKCEGCDQEILLNIEVEKCRTCLHKERRYI